MRPQFHQEARHGLVSKHLSAVSTTTQFSLELQRHTTNAHIRRGLPYVRSDVQAGRTKRTKFSMPKDRGQVPLFQIALGLPWCAAKQSFNPRDPSRSTCHVDKIWLSWQITVSSTPYHPSGFPQRSRSCYTLAGQFQCTQAAATGGRHDVCLTGMNTTIVIFPDLHPERMSLMQSRLCCDQQYCSSRSVLCRGCQDMHNVLILA